MFSKLRAKFSKSKKPAGSSPRTSQAEETGSSASSIKHHENPSSRTENGHQEPRDQLGPSSILTQSQPQNHVNTGSGPEHPQNSPLLKPPPTQTDKPPSLRDQSRAATPSQGKASDKGHGYQKAPSVNEIGTTAAGLITSALGLSENPNSIHIPPIPASLPSRVDETMDSCPRFRIVLIGNAGVGKSSLVQHMFNVDRHEIDVIDGRAGLADIEREYTSFDNPRFVLHDSMGFESGSTTNWDKVERFLKACQAQKDLARRIHAIWFCLLTPRHGSRLLETGDEKLIKMAVDLKIPIITVFTKYDILVNQYIRADKDTSANRISNAQAKAAESLKLSATRLQDVWKRLSSSDSEMDYVGMSISKNTKQEDVRQMLDQLTNVTRSKLRHVEGDLYITWAVAQQVSARQKVDASIDEGLKKYWKDVGKSVAFEGEMVLDCIRRIHEDILKIWGFRDPEKILSGPEFMAKLIGFIAHLIDGSANPSSSISDEVSTISDLVSIVQAAGATALALPLTAISFGTIVLKFLYSKYKRYDVTAKVLATYIVNLVVVLHGIFMDILPSDPPRALSRSIIDDALGLRAPELRQSPFADSGVSTSSESISQVIRKRLGLPRDD